MRTSALLTAAASGRSFWPGEITFNDLLSVLPFNNTIVKAEISGQTLKDMMEMAMMMWPQENGSFPHLSGLTFSVNTEIPSSVVLDEMEEFVGVTGEYRVYDMKVLNRETGEYEPVEPEKKYTIASHNYALVEHGSGMKMLEDTVVLEDEGLLDVDEMERFIVEDLGGVVGQEYAETAVNITFTSGEVSSADETNSTNSTLWIVGMAAGVVLLGLVVVLLRKTGKK